jgi:hypothetical protein
MRNILKMAVVAAAGFAVAASAHAQSAAYNGDLVVGLTTGSGNDLVYDLGSASSLQNGQTWSLGSLFSVNSSTQWGVVGNTLNAGGRQADNQIFSTTASGFTAPSASTSTYAGEQAAVSSIYSLFSAAGAGNYISVPANIGSGNSWYEQTISPSLATQYINAYGNPNVTGITSDLLWSVDDHGAGTVQLGSFSLGGDGTLTYSVVPEPSTFGLLGVCGVIALSLRRQLRCRKI